jgi:uncharacterized protein (DUF433 family)
MTTIVDIGTLIERSPEIRKGRPCIAGTGVSVRRIAGWYNLGLTPEEIAAKIEHLSLAQIHAAITYYHANRDEIDSDIAAEDDVAEQIVPKPAVLAVASRIASMADRDVRQRYHDLADKSLRNGLTVLERFELERIEARLDAEDRDPRIDAQDRKWELERTELLESIQNLLIRLRK